MKLTIYLLSVAVTAVACSGPSGKKEIATTQTVAVASQVELTNEQVKNAGIEIGIPAERLIEQTLRVKGMIDAPPTHKVSVSVPMGGYLKTMRLVPGTKVEKGTTLCEIEDAKYVDMQQDYLVAKSKLSLLESDYARQKDLRQSQSVSEKVYQQVQSDFASQKAIVAGLAEKLRLIGINPSVLNEERITRTIAVRAPISGYISKVNVNAGQYVDPTAVLFEITNSSDIHLSLTVFENDLSKLAIGQSVSCYSNSDPSVRYTGKVALINRSLDTDRAGEVHCHLVTRDKLMPGMFMNAEVHLQSEKALSVPENAIVRWENKFYVFEAQNENRFVMIPVEAGGTTDGFTRVSDTVAGKRIVTTNAYAVLMKLKNNADE